MLVKTALETPEGEINFEANLKPEEVKFILEVGLNLLLQRGAIPFALTGKEGIVNMMQPNGETH